MSTEKLHFKIGISGTYWDKRPQYSILINDREVVAKTEISQESDVVDYVEFTAEIAEGQNQLQIRLENKTDSDTVQNEDCTAIIKDLLLNIHSVDIDEITLGNLVHTKSNFVGNDPARPVLTDCVNMGWNGVWTLKFTSPFYIWLLENI